MPTLKSLNFFVISCIALIAMLMPMPANQYTIPLQVPAEIKAITKIDLAQVACVAKNIFYEAGSESTLGQAAVARVVMNRVAHGFARTPCGVVFQSYMVEREDEDGEPVMKKLCQFSWVCEGKAEPGKNNAKYIEATKIAYAVLVFDTYKEVVPKTTLFFHNLTVNPNWPYRRIAQIDNHIFYAKGRD